MKTKKQLDKDISLFKEGLKEYQAIQDKEKEVLDRFEAQNGMIDNLVSSAEDDNDFKKIQGAKDDLELISIERNVIERKKAEKYEQLEENLQQIKYDHSDIQYDNETAHKDKLIVMQNEIVERAKLDFNAWALLQWKIYKRVPKKEAFMREGFHCLVPKIDEYPLPDGFKLPQISTTPSIKNLVLPE